MGVDSLASALVTHLGGCEQIHRPEMLGGMTAGAELDTGAGNRRRDRAVRKHHSVCMRTRYPHAVTLHDDRVTGPGRR